MEGLEEEEVDQGGGKGEGMERHRRKKIKKKKRKKRRPLMMSLVCDGCSTPWSEVVVLRIQWENTPLKRMETYW